MERARVRGSGSGLALSHGGAGERGPPAAVVRRAVPSPFGEVDGNKDEGGTLGSERERERGAGAGWLGCCALRAARW